MVLSVSVLHSPNFSLTHDLAKTVPVFFFFIHPNLIMLIVILVLRNLCDCFVFTAQGLL